MNAIIKTLGAFAIAGTVAAGGSAFTGGGLTMTADATQFVGGTVSQTISGATLTDVNYTLNTSNPAKTTVGAVVLSFAALTPVTGQDVDVVLTNDAGTPLVENISCAISGAGLIATCTSITAGGFPDLVKLDVTVAPPA
jgi:hypothetical protein